MMMHLVRILAIARVVVLLLAAGIGGPVRCETPGSDICDASSPSGLCAVDWVPYDDGDIDLDLTPSFVSNGENQQAGKCFEAIQAYETKGMISIKDAVKDIAEMKKLGNKVFVMLNGANEGLFFQVDSNTCLGTLAYVAATALNMHEWLIMNPKMLYSPTGRPIRCWDDVVQAEYLLHVLGYGETWVWPGVEVGFSLTVNEVKMTTVALKPKVFLIEDLVKKGEAEAIIEDGERKLYRSPEKHYSESPEFQNYRTSETGTVEDSLPEAKALRKRCQQVARLPHLNYVEPLQLLRYSPGQWYKPHQDLFHHPKYELQDQDADDMDIPSDLKGWATVWRTALYAAAKKVAQLGDHVSGLDKRASDFYFHPNHPLYPLESSEALQEKLYEMAASQDLVSSTYTIPSHSKAKFNRVLEFAVKDGRDILTPISKTWIERALDIELSSEEYALLEKSGFANRVPAINWKREKNRILTILPYLNDVEEGGETVFPRARGPSLFGTNTQERKGMPACSEGAHVPPKAGNAALFYHQLPNGARDELSTHGGCPPVKGTKYAINVFCWNVDWGKGIRQFSV